MCNRTQQQPCEIGAVVIEKLMKIHITTLQCSLAWCYEIQDEGGGGKHPLEVPDSTQNFPSQSFFLSGGYF